MSRILAIAFKDLKLLVRDKAAMFWVMVFPLLMGILFGSIFGGSGGTSALKIALVDEDKSAESQAFVKRLKKSDAVKATDLAYDAAKEKVRKGDFSAYVRIPQGYGEAERQFRIGDGPALQVGMDPSKKAEAGMLQGVVTQAAMGGIAERFSDPKALNSALEKNRADIDNSPMPPDQKASLKRFLGELDRFMQAGAGQQAGVGGSSSGMSGMQGPKIEAEAVTPQGTNPASAYEVTFPQALVWGLFAVVSAFAVSLVKERTQGTLLRLRVSPLSWPQILAGKGLACFLSCVGVMVALLLIGRIVFHIRLNSPVTLAMAVLASSFCFVGLSMLLSTLGKTEQAVGGSASGTLILMAMFGGGMIPIFIMPPWMQKVSAFSPLKWSTLAVEGAIWRGFTVQEMMTPVLILLGFGIVCFAVGVQAMTRARD
jgi:ABC-2 type transport system permease protein